MTAPFAPPPPRPGVMILFGMAAVAAAIPFARRNDWVGWIAFLSVAAVAAGIWGLLAWGVVRAILQWRRGRPDSADAEPGAAPGQRGR
jgi:hypothetical protein